MPRLLAALILAAGIALAGCADGKSPAPTSPSVTPTPSGATLDSYVGNWSSTTNGNPLALPDLGGTNCTGVEYGFTKAPNGLSANVTFKGTCQSLTAQGTGSGTLVDSVLHWTAQGTATYQNQTCNFQFIDDASKGRYNTATQQTNGILINYNVRVCADVYPPNGITVSGSELFHLK
jgi:hypothetical protein